jgi:bacteriorhodopsin
MGFIPFLMYYVIIYNSYVKDEVLVKNNVSIEKKKEIKLLFWYFFLVWSMYGFSALLPYTKKNISYNVLDIFSKNFFGLFLAWKVYKSSKTGSN